MFSLTLRKLLILYALIYFCILIVLAIIFSRDLQMLDKEFEHLSCTSHVNTVIMMIRKTETDYILGSREQDFQQNRKLLEDLGDTLESMVGNFSDTKFPLDLKGLSGLPGEYRAAMGELRRQMTNDMAADHEINNVEALGLKLLEYSGRLIRDEQERLGVLVSSFKRKLVIFVPVFLLVFILISFFQLRGVLNYLKKLEDAAMAIAKGNFSYLKPGQDRGYVHGVYVFRAFNKMLEELKVNQEKLLESHKLSSLGTLASGIAHQLNNPLNNIATSSQIGLIELEEGDPGLTAGMLKIINEEALRAGDIVHGLLEYSRQEMLTIQPAFLAQVVNKAVRLMGDTIPADIEIKNLVPDDLSFPMDARKMTEVFLNLLTNAVHAIQPPGSISLAAEIQKEQKRMTIRVRDTGKGMEDSVVRHIFDPFFTTKEEGEGTGLGLAVVQGIIRQHGGTIRAVSQKGMGTVFYIDFSLVERTFQETEK